MERAQHGEERLTPRQREVWRLVAKGHTNGEIAEQLGISLDGAKWHVGELLTRFGASTREDLVEEWDRHQSPARRARGALAALWGLSWGKAAVATTIVAGAVAAGSFYAMASSESSNPNPLPATTAAVSLPPQPPGATLDIDDAYDLARQAAEERIAEYLPQFLSRPGATTDDMTLIDVRLLQPEEAFEPRVPFYRWDPPPWATQKHWVFSWIGYDLGKVEGPLGGTGDVFVDILLADESTPEVTAWRAHVEALGPPFFGGSGGFNSSSATVIGDGVTQSFHVAWLNGEAVTGELTMYATRTYLCQRFRLNLSSGLGGGGCDARTAVLGPTEMTLAGGVTWPGSGAQQFVAVVYTGDDVKSVAMIGDDGRRLGPYPTSAIPRELALTGRAVLMTSLPFEAHYWLVGYDASSREISRLDAATAILPPSLR